MTVTRDVVDRLCGELPGATLALPPELVSWKVGGKMFACFGGDGEMQGVSVKTADTETSAMLIDAGVAIKAPYFHRSWIRLPFASTDEAEVSLRVSNSYDIVRKSLTSAIRNALPARQEG